MFESSRFGLAALLVTGICVSFASAQFSAQEPEPVLIDSGTREISGYLAVERFEIQPGASVFAHQDIIVDSAGPIVVDGVLGAGDGNMADSDAADITLVSQTWIVVRGELLAGSGADGAWLGESGGGGTNIYLEAPVIWIEGSFMEGGAGGAGGPAADGGPGGTVVINGAIVHVSSGLQIMGGVGGYGGDGLNGSPFLRFVNGGDGGPGGDALFGDCRTASTPWSLRFCAVAALRELPAHREESASRAEMDVKAQMSPVRVLRELRRRTMLLVPLEATEIQVHQRPVALVDPVGTAGTDRWRSTAKVR